MNYSKEKEELLNSNIPNEIIDQLLKYEKAVGRIIEILKTETLTDEEVSEYRELALKIKQKYRILRGEYDVLYFAYQYFSDFYNTENENNLIPKKYSIDDAPDFHRELCGILDTLNEEPTKRICWSVSRGHGKSAYLSNVFPVHQIVYRKRHYILVISETQTMSQKFVEWVADQLKFNKKLQSDFGVLLSANQKANSVDNQEGFVTSTNIRVQAASMGKQLRGARHGSYRPDLCICDDLESARNTNTLELREKNLNWFNSVVMPIGDPTRTSFIYMGTLVHGSGLLPAVLKRSDFQGKIYSAIVSYPERQDLWDKVEEMLREVENPNREQDVDNFYNANFEEMNRGAKTLWSDRFTYLDLIKIKSNIGSRSFASEYLNIAGDDESAIFKSSYFDYYEDKDLYYNNGQKMNMTIVGFWDLALGKNDRSDYNAIITIGIDKRSGAIYVLDAWAAKVPMHEALQVVIQKIMQYQHNVFGVETVQAQYEMLRQLREKLTKMNYYKTRTVGINPRGRKEDRIEELEPLVEQGVIKFKKNQRLLIEMLSQFPNHDHDDLPDALASAVNLGGKQRKRTYWKKPEGF